MRAITTLVFVASLAIPALGAATKMYSDENCENEISKVVYNGFATGDAVVPPEAKAIRVDSLSDVWYAYQSSDGDGCKGDLLRSLRNNRCTPVAPLGIGCTRLCMVGIHGPDGCAVTNIP